MAQRKASRQQPRPYASDALIERTVRAALKQFPKTVKVLDWDWDDGLDHAGRPAVYIHLDLKFISSASKIPATKFSRLAGIIHEEFVGNGIDIWPYVYFSET